MSIMQVSMEPINLATADELQLRQLRNVGEVAAVHIIALREREPLTCEKLAAISSRVPVEQWQAWCDQGIITLGASRHGDSPSDVTPTTAGAMAAATTISASLQAEPSLLNQSSLSTQSSELAQLSPPAQQRQQSSLDGSAGSADSNGLADEDGSKRAFAVCQEVDKVDMH